MLKNYQCTEYIYFNFIAVAVAVVKYGTICIILLDRLGLFTAKSICMLRCSLVTMFAELCRFSLR